MCIFKALGRMQRYEAWQIAVKGARFRAVVADSFLKRAIGLMYRRSMGSRECMLFVFRHEGFPGIWMRNMLFSIDVIWLDKSMRVVEYSRDLQPCKGFGFNCAVHAPSRRSLYIIEAAAGFVNRNRVKIGDKVSIISN